MGGGGGGGGDVVVSMSHMLHALIKETACIRLLHKIYAPSVYGTVHDTEIASRLVEHKKLLKCSAYNVRTINANASLQGGILMQSLSLLRNVQRSFVTQGFDA